MSPEDPVSEVSWGLEASKRSLRKIGSSKARSERLFPLSPGSGIFHQLLPPCHHPLSFAAMGTGPAFWTF
jgi:hypothetical protein